MYVEADRSTIQDHLRNYNVLETFKELRLKNLRFLKRKIDSEDESEEEDQLHIVYNTQPPPRKIQRVQDCHIYCTFYSCSFLRIKME